MITLSAKLHSQSALLHRDQRSLVRQVQFSWVGAGSKKFGTNVLQFFATQLIVIMLVVLVDIFIHFV